MEWASGARPEAGGGSVTTIVSIPFSSSSSHRRSLPTTQAAKKEDAEMWVEKLKQLKKNPQAQVRQANPIRRTKHHTEPSSFRTPAPSRSRPSLLP